MSSGSRLHPNQRRKHRPAASPVPSAEIMDFVAERLRDFQRELAMPLSGQQRSLLGRIALASDYAWESLITDPSLIRRQRRARPLPRNREDSDAGAALRLWRRREALRLIMMDVLDAAPVEKVMSATSALAERAWTRAVELATAELLPRHGHARSADGEQQPLVCIAMGKLGGNELNFSSDIDLILAFPEAGESDGRRALDNEDYFARVAQRAVGLLAEVTEHGYCFRVDLRLRPFGSAGRLVLSFDAMETYYQREGRDWERIAWVRGRPIGSGSVAGAELVHRLTPFVYRRYLDYAAFDGLRDLKHRMDLEVSRRELAGDIKRGPGGIRELEFLVQLPQLVRGGREPGLRQTGILPAISAQLQRRLLPRGEARWMADAYRFLRLLENRVQMMDDHQTHEIPSDRFKRERVAVGMGFAGWDALAEALERQRERVQLAYAAVLGPVEPVGAAVALSPREVDEQALAALWAQANQGGQQDPGPDHELLGPLRHFAGTPGVESMSPRGRARLDRVMPMILSALIDVDRQLITLERWLSVLSAVLRRTSYLALLGERPGLIEEATRLLAQSAWMARLLADAPVLLDELLDPRRRDAIPSRDDYERIVRHELGHAESDLEREVEILRRLQQGEMLRLAYALLEGLQPATAVAATLADLADVILVRVFNMAQREMIRQFGSLPGTSAARPGITIIGYGSLGGRELNFASDLDLVFIYDEALAGCESDGARKLDHHRYFVRLVQRVVHLLTAQTSLGPLYDIDMRLRPNGSKGLLIIGHEAFARYQQNEAWTWEHQALVRARAVAGDRRLAVRFQNIRGEVLAIRREPSVLTAEVASMRQRMRAELDRSNAQQFDLKQGEDGIVDIEFALQEGVLAAAASQPKRPRWPSGTPALIERLYKLGLIPPAQAEQFRLRHQWLVDQGLRRTLALEPRLIARSQWPPPDWQVGET